MEEVEAQPASSSWGESSWSGPLTNYSLELGALADEHAAHSPIPALLSFEDDIEDDWDLASDGSLDVVDGTMTDLPPLTATFLPRLSCAKVRDLLEASVETSAAFESPQEPSDGGCWMLLAKHLGAQAVELDALAVLLREKASALDKLHLAEVGEEELWRETAVDGMLDWHLSQHVA